MPPFPQGIITLNLNTDIDKLLSKTWDLFLGIFGKDADSLELRTWLDEYIRVAFLESRDVQCIGMHEPVLIRDIYQPTRLLRERTKTIRSPEGGREWEAREPEIISVREFLARRENTIITAGPGWGKTTFLRWVFLEFLLRGNNEVLPLLITLRKKNAVQDLSKIVTRLKDIKGRNQKGRILLLVDGYDEIPTEAQKQVSELLVNFTIRNTGEYFLTCRDYYEIFDLKVPRLRISEFTYHDQIGFVGAFLRAYGSNINPRQVVDDLHTRGFSDLIRHPLLLTLATLVKSSSSEMQARNVVSLIEAALNTLTFRWDQEKGVTREHTTPLNGIARLKCLKRLAYSLDLEPVQEHRAIGIIQKQLESMSCDTVEPLPLLLEMARFYGIFVPTAGRWGFVHRSLQDFLAAQYWVETGKFAEALSAGDLKFDSRTAFAGCLMDDGTQVMEIALEQKYGLPVVVEMLRNDASFKHDRISDAIVRFYEQYKGEHYYLRTAEKIECAIEEDFISLASSRFLDYVVRNCASKRGKTTDTLAAYAIVELHRRGVPLSRPAYEACQKNYSSGKFAFVVSNGPYLRLADVRHA